MHFLLAIVICLASAFTVFSQDSSVVYKPLSILTGIEAGVVVDGYDEQYREYLVKGGHWQNRLGVWMTQEVTMNKRLTFKMGVGGLFYNAFPEVRKQPDDYTVKFGPGISQATGIYSFGGEEVEKPWFQLQFGYFPFKYNNEAYNLGEYLLRSGCYPGYIMGGNWNIVGDALYRVIGARLTSFLLDKSIQQHLILSMERDVAPMYDLSLTYIGDVNIAKVIDVGAGIDFHHLISANGDKTTPIDESNRYVPGRALGFGDGIGYDSTGAKIDTFANMAQYYTFRGIKVMGKVCFDPKPLFPASDILGKEDLKVFGEVAVLGLKDYPYYYDDMKKRIPVMFGINLPFFKLLDVCSIQWEWYGSEFENSLYNPLKLQLPLPGGDSNKNLDDTAAYTAALSNSHDPDATAAQKAGDFSSSWTTLRQFYSTDNWKWSIYAKRSFGKRFTLFLQMADDNLRMKLNTGRTQYIPTTRGNMSWDQLFQNQWYFMLRLNYGI
jgi:hypothetical protein